MSPDPSAVTMHPDFAELSVQPGESHITGRHELFHIANLVTLGGSDALGTHLPVEVGRIDAPIAMWESTGAASQLPFWNTNLDGDQWLYVVHGQVRVEFKATEGTERFGHYLARTGDLFKMPKEVAHRTYSADGKRRIGLELLPVNPFWELMGQQEIVASSSGRAGSLQFELAGDSVQVRSPEATVDCPREMFLAAARTLLKFELHLGHNELDGGLVVHDLGTDVRVALAGHSEVMPGAELLGVFKGLVEQ